MEALPRTVGTVIFTPSAAPGGNQSSASYFLPTSEVPEVTHTPLEQKAPAELVSAEPGFCTNRAPTVSGFPLSAAAGQIPQESGQRRRKGEEEPAMVTSVVQKPPFHRDELGGVQTDRYTKNLGRRQSVVVSANT